MTESEAKTKWCPFVRAIFIGDGTFIGPCNRGVGQDGKEGELGSRCIGSRCMAWRDATINETRTMSASGPPPGPGWVVECEWEAARLEISDSPKMLQRWKLPGVPSGYCGLAGAQP